MMSLLWPSTAPITALTRMPWLLNFWTKEPHRSSNPGTTLNYFAYNFIKIHRTLRVSPAMAADVTDRPWDVNDLIALWEAYEQRRTERQVPWGNSYDSAADT